MLESLAGQKFLVDPANRPEFVNSKASFLHYCISHFAFDNYSFQPLKNSVQNLCKLFLPDIQSPWFRYAAMVFNMAAEFGFPSLDAYLYHNKGVNPTLAKFDILNPIKLLALSDTMSKIGLEQLNYKLEVLENPAHGMERNFFINPLTVQGGKINCSTLNSPNRSNEREFFRYPVYLPNPERMQNIIALPFDYTTFDELLDAKQFAKHECAIYQAFDQIVDISTIFHSYFANPYDQVAY